MMSPAPKLWIAMHAADRFVRGIDRGKPDQIGMVIFVIVGRGQFFARDIEFDAVEFFGVVAGRDALEGRDQMVFGLAGVRHSN